MKYVFCLLAGACDALTGFLLLVAPAWTLHVMRIPEIPADLVWMRWIGAFVFSVGAAYWIPFRSRDPRDFTAMLAITAWIRLVIGVFVAGSVATAALPRAWLTVSAVDLALAAIQWVLLRTGAFRRAA